MVTVPSSDLSIVVITLQLIGFDVLQDLTNLYDQYRSIEPWLQRKNGLEKDGREHFQSVEDRKKLVGWKIAI